MYVKELEIIDFKNFYGKHVFRLRRGANIISGASGMGKTNLCRAMEFDLFGGGAMKPSDASSMVNYKLVEEAKDECRRVSCTVKMILEDDAGEHWVERDFSPFPLDFPSLYVDHAREDAVYSVHVSGKISPQGYRDYVYVGKSLCGFKSSGASALGDVEGVLEHLMGLADKNKASGFGVLLLDDAVGRLRDPGADEVFRSLTGAGLDQVIWLAQPHRIPEGESAYRLGETIESVTFKAAGFPFDAQHLRREVGVMVSDSYVKHGDIYEREVYGHRYTVEAVEVTPDGGRYRSGASRMTVT